MTDECFAVMVQLIQGRKTHFVLNLHEALPLCHQGSGFLVRVARKPSTKSTMKSQLKSNGDRSWLGALALAGLITVTTSPVFAASIFWQGGTASYTNTANWNGGV